MRLLAGLKLIASTRCEEATRLVSESLDRDLSRVERTALVLHRMVCRPCRRFMKQMNDLHRAFRSMPKSMRKKLSQSVVVRLAPERRERIKRMLAEASRLESN